MKANRERDLIKRRVAFRPKLRGRDEGPGGLHRPGSHSKIFLPGQPVPETGIYEVLHDKAHSQAHEAVMHGSDLFPACDQCDTRVRFRLVRTAPYIFEDEDFVDEK